MKSPLMHPYIQGSLLLPSIMVAIGVLVVIFSPKTKPPAQPLSDMVYSKFRDDCGTKAHSETYVLERGEIKKTFTCIQY